MAANANTRPAFNDRILYFGANPGSRATELDALGPNVSQVITTSSSSIVKYGGVSHDLATPEGVLHFADAVGTTPEQRVKLATLLGRLSPADRDEMGKVAAAWAPGERGGSVPSRFVISGHSGGAIVFGDNHDGDLSYENVRELAGIMPRAAAQIEDIHFASCNSENKIQDSESWKKSFPNLKTMWGYRGTSPLAPAGDLHAWEVATRGRNGTLSEGLMQSHGNATAWSVNAGVTNSGQSIADRRLNAATARTHFADYFSGKTGIPDPQEHEVKSDYNALRLLASAHDATPTEKADATKLGDQMLRLRFWDTSVRQKIATTYGAQINATLKAAGMPSVDFNTLSRKDALAVFSEYEKRTGSLTGVMTGIRDLTPETIPEGWC